MQDTINLMPIEQAVRTSFKLSVAQRRECSLSFIVHYPKVNYLELRELARTNQYLVLDHEFAHTKLIAKLAFPTMPICLTPQVTDANILISVRTLHGVSYAIVAPAIRFVDTGNVKIVWDSLDELASKNLCSLYEISKLLDSDSL